MGRERSIAITYRKMKLHEQKTDFEFWQSQTPEKRLAVLEEIRSVYKAWEYDTEPRFQRVLSITRQK